MGREKDLLFCWIPSEGWNRFQIQEEGKVGEGSLVPWLQAVAALLTFITKQSILHEICAVLRSDLQSYNYPGNSGLMFLKISR